MTDTQKNLHMRKIRIMSGLPGSGKSTYIDQHAKLDALVLRRDDRRELLRKELGLTHSNQCPKALEYQRWVEYLQQSLSQKPNTDVYIDQTTLSMGALKKLLSAIAPVIGSNDRIIIIRLHTNLPECLRRNAMRKGDAKVPKRIIRSMAETMRRDPITIDGIREAFPSMRFNMQHIR